jgi:hypothetical protein
MITNDLIISGCVLDFEINESVTASAEIPQSLNNTNFTANLEEVNVYHTN